MGSCGEIVPTRSKGASRWEKTRLEDPLGFASILPGDSDLELGLGASSLPF